MSVSLTLSDSGTISDITAASESETPDFWAKAVNILDIIRGQNDTDGLIEKLENKEIEAVTGATYSAKGIVLATEDALSKATSGFAGGTGTESDPYLISSEAGLRYLQAQGGWHHLCRSVPQADLRHRSDRRVDAHRLLRHAGLRRNV